MSLKTGTCLSLAFAGLLTTIACAGGGASAASDKTGSSTAAAATPAVSPAVLETGRAIYKKNCVACHGESGKGDGPGAGVLKPPPRDHTDSAYMSTLSDKNVADVIVMGGAIKGRPLMPSHPQIRGAELDALVAYVRSLSKK